MPARLQSNENNRSVLLDKPIVFVGRHPECDVVINNSRKVSRKHCCFAEVNGRFILRDLGSTNGVQINNRRVAGTHELAHGDQVMIGDCAYVFYQGNLSPEPQPAEIRPEANEHPSDDGDIHRNSPLQPISDPQRDELSGDMPVMLSEDHEAESENDGFEMFGDNHAGFKRRRGSRADSDSQMELAID